MHQEKRPYHSYLLRIWQEGDCADSWRASLQNVISGDLVGFGSLNGLLAFLHDQHAEKGKRPLSQPTNKADRNR